MSFLLSSKIVDLLTASLFTRRRYGTISPRRSYLAGLSGGMIVMAEGRFASSNANACEGPAADEQFLHLLRRWILETEQAILRSRELIRSTHDAIELLERLQTRQRSS
jgi:hypothetical protein